MKNEYICTQTDESNVAEDITTKHPKEILKICKQNAYDYYKINGNLNELIYECDNQKIRKKLEKWLKQFYEKTSEEKRIQERTFTQEDKSKMLIN